MPTLATKILELGKRYAEISVDRNFDAKKPMTTVPGVPAASFGTQLLPAFNGA